MNIDRILIESLVDCKVVDNSLLKDALHQDDIEIAFDNSEEIEAKCLMVPELDDDNEWEFWPKDRPLDWEKYSFRIKVMSKSDERDEMVKALNSLTGIAKVQHIAKFLTGLEL